ncbi:MAG: preprotein translocase subunit SecA [Ignavibacteria bacterium]|nr:preprotein translocase subunit SecA [Ignavibacteria bacterium]
MLKFIRSIVGSKHDKDIKIVRPIVEEINEIFAPLAEKPDEYFKNRVDELKTQIGATVSDLIQETQEIRERLREDSELTHSERSDLYARLSEIDREEFTTIQDELNSILPEVFAMVKDVCRRLVGHKYLVAGQESVWDMVPYDVQLIGGIVLHQGKIAEMATGEGKTLVATLPLVLNSMAGRGVHLVTVNDYLAGRDREWMKPIFDMFGITTGCIQSNMQPALRQREYSADITYGTNNEFGFDYLRDNMVNDPVDMVQRPHWYAIVDEVDSVLVDEARTPLIISGPVTSGSTEQSFDDMNPRVKRLIEVQNRLVNSLIGEAEKGLASGKKEDRIEAGVAILRSHRGMPKHARLMKILQDPDNMKLMKETELDYLKEQGQRMQIIDEGLYFSVDERNHQIDLSDQGRELICSAQEDPNMFVLPDIASEYSAVEGDESLTAEEKTKRKDSMMLVFAERSDRIHIVNQLLRAYTLYVRDDEYVVQDGKIKIVDEFTGRILEGRRYSDGLHQAIEAKEGVTVEQDTQTFATVTLQNYFRLYHKLAGMTGTAETEAAEFWQIYKLDVVVIPTNRDIVRADKNDLIYRTKREKYNAVVEATQAELDKGRAVLVGTTSVEVSELLSKMLKRANIKHNVLNAKQHQREAEIVSNAGRKGSVTIATNMAGRGTDIKLDSEVKANGGLAIVGTERHESRRIDRQLRGRAGRQGDPGSSQFFISLEEDLMRLFGGERIASAMQRMKVPEGEPIDSGLVTKSVENAQKKVESNNFGTRKRLLEYDDVMNQQREVIYDRRRHALMGERLKSEIVEYISEMANDWFDEFHESGDAVGLKNSVRVTLLSDPKFKDEAFKDMSREAVVESIAEAALEFYNRKETMLGSDYMGRLERYAALQAIDEMWRDHLRGMDDLKEGIYLRAYGQKDPLLEYKQEAYKIFLELLKDINKSQVHFAFKYFPQLSPQDKKNLAAQEKANQVETNSNGEKELPTLRSTVTSSRQLSFSHPTAAGAFQQPSSGGGEGVTQTIKNTGRMYGRNEPCPLDPAKKFKNCCGATGNKTCTKHRE